MQTHLLESRSQNQLSRDMGLHKLELCMMILREVESSYPSAKFIRWIFLEAVDRLNAIQNEKETSPDSLHPDKAFPEHEEPLNPSYSSLSDIPLDDLWL